MPKPDILALTYVRSSEFTEARLTNAWPAGLVLAAGVAPLQFVLDRLTDKKAWNERDDLMSATRYALMMLRFADTIYMSRRAREDRLRDLRSWMDA